MTFWFEYSSNSLDHWRERSDWRPSRPDRAAIRPAAGGVFYAFRIFGREFTLNSFDEFSLQAYKIH